LVKVVPLRADPLGAARTTLENGGSARRKRCLKRDRTPRVRVRLWSSLSYGVGVLFVLALAFFTAALVVRRASHGTIWTITVSAAPISCSFTHLPVLCPLQTQARHGSPSSVWLIKLPTEHAGVKLCALRLPRRKFPNESPRLPWMTSPPENTGRHHGPLVDALGHSARVQSVETL
jgi:hypothetical protein